MHKRKIIIFVLLLTILLCGCKKILYCDMTEERTYSNSNLEEFRREYLHSQEEIDENESLKAEQEAMEFTVLPLLDPDKFKFCSVIVGQISYCYLYEDTEGDSNYWIYVSRRNETLSEVVSELYEEVPENERRFKGKDEWILECYGKCIYVKFSPYTDIFSSEEIDEYFTFEPYYVTAYSFDYPQILIRP